MNWFIGFRRILIFLTILYWIGAVKIAIVQATLGFYPDPMTVLACAAWIYLVCFGFFWALLGFFIWPGKGW